MIIGCEVCKAYEYINQIVLSFDVYNHVVLSQTFSLADRDFLAVSWSHHLVELVIVDIWLFLMPVLDYDYFIEVYLTTDHKIANNHSRTATDTSHAVH
jgi:hypothetical protein